MRILLRLTAALAVLAAAAPAVAQNRALAVAGYAGSLETTLRAEIIPSFEKKTGVRVDYLPGNSNETLARSLFGARAIDVVIADEAAIVDAVRSGFCGPIEGLPADDLQAAARFADDKAVALGLVGTGLMYNTKIFKEKGWAPPSSWNDLKDPKYRRRVVMPPITDSYGLEALVMLARANGGGENNIEPGFKALREQVGPNIASFESDPAKITELFRTGQADVAVWGSGRAQSLASVGIPVGFVYPKEGTPRAISAACPTAWTERNGLASAFVNMLLQPGLQRLFSRDYGYAPALKSVSLPADRATIAPVGEHAAALIALDWEEVNASRAEWTARWKREFDQ